MEQVGARAASPMTLLREYTTALRALLHGRTVTTSGRYVQLADVRLDWPPSPAPPLLVGAVREKTVALAGELGDGVILTGETSPEQLREAMVHLRAGRQVSGRDGTGDVVVFVTITGPLDAAAVAARVAEYADAGATHVALHALEGTGELADVARFVAHEVRPLVS
jgi:alkanesulfonate monooxygenase SsuD/methylene tetrahydromethanopterin reductase-like flavin-dependent oxidoreductase (luciferase family)